MYLLYCLLITYARCLYKIIIPVLDIKIPHRFIDCSLVSIAILHNHFFLFLRQCFQRYFSYVNDFKIINIHQFFSISQPALRQNLKPVAIWIYDEINSHCFIFEANASHLFVLFVCCLVILCLECQVEFAFTQIIWLWMIFKPGKFQLKITYIVAQIHNDKIICSLSSHFVQIKSLVVKFNRSLQI